MRYEGGEEGGREGGGGKWMERSGRVKGGGKEDVPVVIAGTRNEDGGATVFVYV